jgi:DNA adenine methylase
MAKPFLQWAGGKRQLIDRLTAHTPRRFNSYYEPFIGGGALLFRINPDRGKIGDVNTKLCNTYKAVRDASEELIQTLDDNFVQPQSNTDNDLPFNDQENFYYQQRKLFNQTNPSTAKEHIEQSARFIYLNRTCYNGLYRENSDGEFNTPIGSNETPSWCNPSAIRDASHVLSGCIIDNSDFEVSLMSAEPGDFIYLDPPYKPMSRTANFNNYSEGGFDQQDQIRLYETCRSLDQQGVKLLISNSAVMYDTYNENFETKLVDAKRVINSDADKRGDVKEMLATNVDKKDRGWSRSSTLDQFT